IVSAYCPGATLAEWLKNRQEPVPFREAAGLVAVLADAAAHAHDHGVIHRDLKPANVILTADGRPQAAGGEGEKGSSLTAVCYPLSAIPKITDFGLAKLLETSSDAPTRSGVILGTFNYMSPEQAAGRVHQTGPAADIYSLGAILYELLTGRPPFRG